MGISPITPAMVISHNHLIGGKQDSPSCTALCAATPSNRHDVFNAQITLAEPVFDPQRQIIGISSGARDQAVILG
jgi:hypothetical protein